MFSGYNYILCPSRQRSGSFKLRCCALKKQAWSITDGYRLTKDAGFSLTGPTQGLEEPAVKAVGDLLSETCGLI